MTDRLHTAVLATMRRQMVRAQDADWTQT